jgi:hypothetical protein
MEALKEWSVLYGKWSSHRLDLIVMHVILHRFTGELDKADEKNFFFCEMRVYRVKVKKIATYYTPIRGKAGIRSRAARGRFFCREPAKLRSGQGRTLTLMTTTGHRSRHGSGSGTAQDEL